MVVESLEIIASVKRLKCLAVKITFIIYKFYLDLPDELITSISALIPFLRISVRRRKYKHRVGRSASKLFEGIYLLIQIIKKMYLIKILAKISKLEP